MANQAAKEHQLATLRTIWERYRAFAKASGRLKGEQGQWRRALLIASVVALLAVPFSRALEKSQFVQVSSVLAVVATVLFALVGWLNESILGDESQQPWVRARQTAEGLKALAFRFLGGLPPFDTEDAPANALKQAEEIVGNAGVPDTVASAEAEKGMPPAPITIQDYVKLRVEDQLGFYERAVERERAASRRIVTIGRAISVSVILFGALGAMIAQAWRDIWAPALGAASALVTTRVAVSRHRFLLETYSLAANKLRFANGIWNASRKTGADEAALLTTVESILASENAGWVQQMLLKPVVPDKVTSVAKANG